MPVFWFGSVLPCVLVFQWTSGIQVAVLEDNSCTAENGINCAVYVAVSVELPERMYI